ncbi:MAG: energy transducer TonB [Acidobacteriota bacterium]
MAGQQVAGVDTSTRSQAVEPATEPRTSDEPAALPPTDRPPVPPRPDTRPVRTEAAAAAPPVTSTTQARSPEAATARSVLGESRPARKLYSPSPDYPATAQRDGLIGMVVVEADIDDTGTVTDTRVVRGNAAALDLAAIEALQSWRFEPALQDGTPVASSYRVGFEFALPKDNDGLAPVEVSGDIEPPRRLETPLPVYPNTAWAQGITGDVLVQAVIDETGAVADVKVLKGLPHGLTEAAVEAIRRWRFEPATRHGQPVAVYHNLSVRFET